MDNNYEKGAWDGMGCLMDGAFIIALLGFGVYFTCQLKEQWAYLFWALFCLIVFLHGDHTALMKRLHGKD